MESLTNTDNLTAHHSNAKIGASFFFSHFNDKKQAVPPSGGLLSTTKAMMDALGRQDRKEDTQQRLRGTQHLQQQEEWMTCPDDKERTSV
jgi:hypothetical protein